jgi:hypothetical protein
MRFPPPARGAESANRKSKDNSSACDLTNHVCRRETRDCIRCTTRGLFFAQSRRARHRRERRRRLGFERFELEKRDSKLFKAGFQLAKRWRVFRRRRGHGGQTKITHGTEQGLGDSMVGTLLHREQRA